MAVVWTILKILGIIILCIIGLILLILLMVLFIPIRYQAEGGYTTEKIGAAVKVRWFIFRILANYNKGDPFTVKAKVGPFTVYSMSKGGEPEALEDGTQHMLPPPEEITGDGNAGTEAGAAGEGNKPKEEVKADQTSAAGADKESKNSDKKPDKKAGKKEKKKKPQENVFEGTVEPPDLGEDIEKTLKESPFDKLDRIRIKVEKKRSHIEQFLAKECTKKTIERGKKLLKKIFKHLKPTKGHVDLHFGLGSAADTGMILGKIARHYPLFGNWLFINPDFYNKVIEAEGMVKGRIRIGTLAIPALLFYLRKDTRRTIKLAKKI